MCGIIGSTKLNVFDGLEAISHRGRDAWLTMEYGLMKLGHRRLSILDLDTRSNQPYLKGNLALVYNGELWNYLELKAELSELGYSFNTTGDTEVVATALLHWGVDALSKFNGMFAMSWTNGTTVWLARDKFGEVPVYYNSSNGFHFCSEMKGLLALGLKDNQLLDCAHYIEYDIQKNLMVSASHYEIPDKSISDDAENIIFNMKRMILNAVREREISDVPICTLLSGGIDSSLITAILAKNFPDIVAYSAVYNDKSADLKSARALAKELNIKLVEVKIEPPTKEDIERTIMCVESPLKTQIEIAYPCIKLAEAIHSDGFKVTFSGDGSDEMFGSYRFAYYGIRDMGYTQYIRKLYHSLSYRNYIRNNKAFMSHSVEVRLPFANTELVEYVLNIQGNIAYNPKNEKWLLKSAMQGILPEFITKRRKIGFQDGLGIKPAFRNASEPSYYKQYYKSQFNG